VDNAIGGGGRAASGGHRPDGPGYFYRPTIISGVSDDTALVAEEQFGPALPVLPFTDVPEAIERANKGHYGLTASIWSADPGLAGDVARHIDAGQVSVNVHAGGARPDLPFGGHKWSGIGVENGPWGLLSFTETQVICGPPR
jgi:acyl-CoA reductase-like NAD-dependent aldehyde dehydrogenase